MIRIRNQIKEEIDEVMDIWIKSTIGAHDFIPEEYWRKNYDMVKDFYIPKSTTYVYLKNEKILGFISILDEEFIAAIFVKIENQSEGIGRELIEFVKNKHKKLSLEVYEKNIRAIKFYKKIGFELGARKKNNETEELEYRMEMTN